MMSTEEVPAISVTGLDLESFERVKAVARELAIYTNAGVVRFAVEQFARGKSINDFDPPPREGSPPARR